MAKILITGASGGLGSQIYQHLAPRYAVSGLCFKQRQPNLATLDLVNQADVLDYVQSLRPELIIHTVGLTDVDLCDRDLSKALDINTRTTLHIREAAEKMGTKLIHISTNDVFSGQEGLYTEADLPQPINMYAWTKWMAEQMLYRYKNSLILRFTILSWFTSGKIAFPQWIAQNLSQNQAITLFQDQFNSPLYVKTVAQWIEMLFEAQGIYHLGSERKSRFETGWAIADKLGLDTSLIRGGSVQDVDLFAPRPLDVSLNCERVKRDWGLETTFQAEIENLIQDRPLDVVLEEKR